MTGLEITSSALKGQGWQLREDRRDGENRKNNMQKKKGKFYMH